MTVHPRCTFGWFPIERFVRSDALLSIVPAFVAWRFIVKRSPLWAILFVAFVDLIAFGLIIPLQAVYAKRMGASGVTLGALIGVYAFMQMMFNPILGRWSDRVGRRRVLMLSIAGSVISHLMLGVGDLHRSLLLLFAARILDGISGANIATAQAYIADVTAPKDRAKAMGFFGAAFGLGFVLGPALGAGLVVVGRTVSGASGTAWPAFGAAVISTIAFVLVWRYVPESRPTEKKPDGGFRVFHWAAFREALAHPRLRELLVLVFTSIFAFVLLEATFVYLCAERFGVTEAGTGLLFAYIGVLMVIMQGGLVGRLVRRFGEPWLVGVGPFLTAVGFALLACVPSAEGMTAAWAFLLVGCLPVSWGHGLTGPCLNALVSRQARDEHMGAVLGVSQGMASFARGIGPIVGGLLYDLGPAWPYWAGAVLFVTVGGYALYVRPAHQRAIREERAG